jgi:hypothetical protein
MRSSLFLAIDGDVAEDVLEESEKRVPGANVVKVFCLLVCSPVSDLSHGQASSKVGTAGLHSYKV